MTISIGLQNIHCDTGDLKHFTKISCNIIFLKKLIFNLMQIQ